LNDSRNINSNISNNNVTIVIIDNDRFYRLIEAANVDLKTAEDSILI